MGQRPYPYGPNDSRFSKARVNNSFPTKRTRQEHTHIKNPALLILEKQEPDKTDKGTTQDKTWSQPTQAPHQHLLPVENWSIVRKTKTEKETIH